MADLIIGHTTHDSAWVWLRGDETQRFARVTLWGPCESSQDVTLAAGVDPIGVAKFQRLWPSHDYAVRARFASTREGLDERGASVPVGGWLRTFPEPASGAPISFLHGSCNLSIVSLSNLGSLAAGALGMLTATRSLERAAQGSLRWRIALRIGNGIVRFVYGALFLLGAVKVAARWIWALCTGQKRPPWPKWNEKATLVYAVFYVVYKLTGFKLKKPFLPKPFGKLCDVVEGGLEGEPRPAFAMHAGDQIYFDFPFPGRDPTDAAYRLAYREAWFGDESLRHFLTLCPQYMTLDDHEIVDGFGTDSSLPDWDRYLEAAGGAYGDFVDSRHPSASGSLFYEFSCGAAHFFVLDTRTERRPDDREMIGHKQMNALECWLLDKKEGVRFIVSSVPFVAELEPGPTEASPKHDQRDDKWCGRLFNAQRQQIIELLHAEQIDRVVFLTGDTHCCYHASMQVGWPHDRITIHELAGGPIYQLQFGSRQQFFDQRRGFVGSGEKLPFRSALQQLHGSTSGVLHVSVEPGVSPELRWQVIQTSPELESAAQSRPQSGRIRFEEHRHF